MNNLKPYKNYKPSNIAWLGEIPEHWEVRKLKFIINGKLKYGANEPGGDLRENDPRYIRITDFDKKGNLRKDTFCSLKKELAIPYLLKNGDILFARSGATVGKTFQFKNYSGMACYAGYLIKAEPNEKIILSDYLYHFTCSGVYENWKGFIFNKATIENIGADKYCNLPVFIPSIHEQQAIANFLDYKLSKIDRFIQKKKQLIKLLNEQKAGIINDAVTKGLNPNAKMKPSNIEWLGDIPEHWDSVRTKNVFKLVTEVAPPNNTEVLLSIYTQYGVKPRTEFEERGNRATTTDNYWIVKKQDIIVNKLLAWMGAIGISEYDGVTSPAYDILRSRGKADPYFYHYLFRSPIAFTEFKRHSRGIMDVRLRLYFSEFGDIKLPVPPLEEQTAIVQHIEQETAQINTIIQTIEKEIALTQEYRVALIAEAVTGKIDVRDYEIPETPIVELYEEMEDEMSLAAEEEAEYGAFL